MLPTSFSNVSKTNPWLVEASVVDRYARHEVLQARWHPACPRHLVVLFSSNLLKLVDTDHRVSLQVLPLALPSPCPRRSLYEPVPLAVDFDFGPPRLKWCIQQQKAATELPILVLLANAECLCAILSPERAMLYEVDQGRQGSKEIESGSVQVSSVMVLPCKVPVVVIGFTSGLLYHWVFIDDGVKKTLKPIERLDIKFGMLGKRNIRSHLIFIRDFETTNRYFILHEAGLHSVVLPAISALDAFINADNLYEDRLKLKIALMRMESAMKYTLCTLVPGLTKRSPVYGAGVIGAAQKTIALMVVLGDGTPLPLSVEPCPSHTRLIHNPMSKSFSESVRDFLQGSDCLRPPLLRLTHALSPLTEDVLNFLVGTIKALRETKMNKHAYIAYLTEIKIQNNIGRINDQLESTIALLVAKEELRLNAERIAERYEEEKDKFIVLRSRLERIGVALNMQSTVEEVKANTELQEMQHRAVELAAAMQRLQTLFELNHLEMKVQKELSELNLADDGSPVLNKKQQHKIFSRLKDMSQTIKELLDQLESVKTYILNAKND